MHKTELSKQFRGSFLLVMLHRVASQPDKLVIVITSEDALRTDCESEAAALEF